MELIRWGIVGCGDVTEVKSGPGFQKAGGSALVAVMRRNREKAEDYASRHGIARYYGRVNELLADRDVDAVYIATPPSSHLELALQVAGAGKPCLVEKPMAMNYGECLGMIRAFEERSLPLFVAYYRRALPRFLKVRQLIRNRVAGDITSVQIVQYNRLASPEKAKNWRFDPRIAGGGLFMDLGSHGLDILDFFLGPIRDASGFSTNTAGAYPADDLTAAVLQFESGILGTGVWNFNADHDEDRIILTGSRGEIECPVFSDGDVIVRTGTSEEVYPFRNPPHVHQPLIQSVVDELLGKGTCESTGLSAARTARVMDQCVARR